MTGASHSETDLAECANWRAAEVFQERLLSAYLIGSIAHGGFSASTSDVDIAFVLAGHDGTESPVLAQIKNELISQNRPLADRLSFFWGSLAGDEWSSGRFPAIDLLDLHQSGLLTYGTDVRTRIPIPGHTDLVQSSAQFVVDVLGQPLKIREIRDPARAAVSARSASKLALFPVRFAYTLATGRVGPVEDAVGWYLAGQGTETTRRLVAEALAWRSQWTDGDMAKAEVLLSACPAMYASCARQLAGAIRSLGSQDLAEALESFASIVHCG